MHLLCIGEIMAEISGDYPEFNIGFAGDTFNTAVYCRRLLHDSDQVSFLTRLGGDPLSAACRSFTVQHDLDMARSPTDRSAKIGLYAIATDEAGERTFTYWRNTSAARELFSRAEDVSAMSGVDMIYFSGITLAVISPQAREAFFAQLAHLRAAGVLVAFDSNYRPSLWENKDTAQTITARAWGMCDIALPSLDDEMALFDDADETEVVARLTALGCRKGGLKRGALGPIAIDGSETGTFSSIAKPVDTTAAGDSFNAGFLTAFMQGKTTAEALASGHGLATQVVAKRGAIVDTTGE